MVEPSEQPDIGERPELDACPLCHSPARPAFAVTDLNRGVSEELFSYRRCKACDTYFIDEIPADLARYYPSDYYHPLSRDELDSLATRERPKVEMVLEQVAPGRLVEIGPGDGVFARAARNAGFDVTAIEMNREVCGHLRAVGEITAIVSDAPEAVLPELQPSRAIAMWHVIEHLPDPVAVLDAASRNLEPGGVLVIATPNPQAFQFKVLGRRWAHVDAPRHLALIPASALRSRCEQLGLRVAATTTSDPAGRHWNWFGWDYALRRAPRSRRAGIANRVCSRLLATALTPVEAHGLKGCAYTSVFVKPALGDGSTGG